MKDLTNIDLISVNCVNPEDSVKALIHSSKQITFGSTKLLSHYRPKNLPDYIEYIEIAKQTYETMNWFHLNTLPKYISNEYMLSIQDDGFIINPHLWEDIFLDYDYIGAPWPTGHEWCRINRVGNGGFVLKSKKFLNLEESIPYTDKNNDVLVTNTYYDYFRQRGCKYASVEVAARFSLEHAVPECEYNLDNTFGFHGKLHQASRDRIKQVQMYDK
jgi:hypothetical protein